MRIIEASKILGTSDATVRNWIKQDFLPTDLTLEAVEKLKKMIDNHEIDVLNKRANKTNSNLYYIPFEYANNTGIISPIKQLRSLAFKYFTDLKDFLFNATICYLTVTEEFTYFFGVQTIRRQIIEEILRKYYPCFKINMRFYEASINYFMRLKQNECEDVLGILYQSFRKVGTRSKNGSYYTPHEITASLNNSLENVTSYYDPCCGTGSFLINAVKQLKIKPENIYGTDIDEHAVFIAKINLLLLFRDYNQEPNIFCNDIISENSDTLKDSFRDKFDAIVTNPPWGAAKNEDKYLKYKTLLKSNEIFSTFIMMSLNILKTNGEMLFLLPKSILNIKIHASIRHFILENSQIITIKEFGKAFTNVFTSVILLHLRKKEADDDHKILIENKNKKFVVSQKNFKKNTNYIFDINTDESENELIEKIYSVPHKTLTDNAIWGLGIITGNNERFLSNKKTDNNEPIIKGTDIDYFKINTPEKYIHFDINLLRQVAAEEIYRHEEKLIYKFISNFLVFAYDDKRYLTLNSANCLIPKIEGYSTKTILAFLNSKVFQFIFSKRFSTHKILRTDIETLPFPDISSEQHALLENLTTMTIRGEDKKAEIDNIIYQIFNLNDDDIKKIE
jgi:tRNA1(Val) A37 N6-methylase TrmN6